MWEVREENNNQVLEHKYSKIFFPPVCQGVNVFVSIKDGATFDPGRTKGAGLCDALSNNLFLFIVCSVVMRAALLEMPVEINHILVCKGGIVFD